MSVQGKIKRYYLIVEKIGKSRFAPTFKEIKTFLEDEGFSISKRTLQRDFESLRDEFGIKINYDKYKNAYYIDTEKSLEIENFLQILNTAITAEILIESIKDYKKLTEYVQLGSNTNIKVLDILKELLFAVKNSRRISFSYKSFYRDEAKKYTIQPYLLKEYLNRWYIVGIYDETKGFRTFGIDRIEELFIHTESFIRDEKVDPKEIFEHSIGLDYSYKKVEKVVLNFTSSQSKYVKTQPLHPSQTIIKENKDECLVQLNIIPNYELIQRILMNANEVKVVEPKWLRDEVLRLLKLTIDKYKN